MIRLGLLLAVLGGAVIYGAATSSPSYLALGAGALVGPWTFVIGVELTLRGIARARARRRGDRRGGYVHR